MDIRTILVSIDVDCASPAIIHCAADLATRFGASVIGVAAARPTTGLVIVEGAVVTEQLYQEERAQIEQTLRTAEDKFRALMPAGLDVKWRGFLDAPTRSVIGLASRADLVMLTPAAGSHNDYRHVDISDVVVAAGRPVLITGQSVASLSSKKVVVAWKDTREARRAIVDALPFLRVADEVLALTVEEDDFGPARASLDELTHWLASHDVHALSDTLALTDTAGKVIEAAAKSFGADLVVSGAYGHTRVREWLLGGVTRQLLAADGLNRLLAN